MDNVLQPPSHYDLATALGPKTIYAGYNPLLGFKRPRTVGKTQPEEERRLNASKLIQRVWRGHHARRELANARILPVDAANIGTIHEMPFNDGPSLMGTSLTTAFSVKTSRTILNFCSRSRLLNLGQDAKRPLKWLRVLSLLMLLPFQKVRHRLKTATTLLPMSKASNLRSFLTTDNQLLHLMSASNNLLLPWNPTLLRA